MSTAECANKLKVKSERKKNTNQKSEYDMLSGMFYDALYTRKAVDTRKAQQVSQPAVAGTLCWVERGVCARRTSSRSLCLFDGGSVSRSEHRVSSGCLCGTACLSLLVLRVVYTSPKKTAAAFQLWCDTFFCSVNRRFLGGKHSSTVVATRAAGTDTNTKTYDRGDLLFAFRFLFVVVGVVCFHPQEVRHKRNVYNAPYIRTTVIQVVPPTSLIHDE